MPAPRELSLHGDEGLCPVQQPGMSCSCRRDSRLVTDDDATLGWEPQDPFDNRVGLQDLGRSWGEMDRL
jgi:hypothetical protein